MYYNSIGKRSSDDLGVVVNNNEGGVVFAGKNVQFFAYFQLLARVPYCNITSSR